MTTITYQDVLARFAPDAPILPCLRVVHDAVECYLPAWTPADKIIALVKRCATTWPRHGVNIFLVTALPTEALCGDWAAPWPQDTSNRHPAGCQRCHTNAKEP